MKKVVLWIDKSISTWTNEPIPTFAYLLLPPSHVIVYLVLHPSHVIVYSYLLFPPCHVIVYLVLPLSIWLFTYTVLFPPSHVILFTYICPMWFCLRLSIAPSVPCDCLSITPSIHVIVYVQCATPSVSCDFVYVHPSHVILFTYIVCTYFNAHIIYNFIIFFNYFLSKSLNVKLLFMENF